MIEIYTCHKMYHLECIFLCLISFQLPVPRLERRQEVRPGTVTQLLKLLIRGSIEHIVGFRTLDQAFLLGGRHGNGRPRTSGTMMSKSLETNIC